MQVDGVEEELPDELENACSDSKMLKYTHSCMCRKFPSSNFYSAVSLLCHLILVVLCPL